MRKMCIVLSVLRNEENKSEQYESAQSLQDQESNSNQIPACLSSSITLPSL